MADVTLIALADAAPSSGRARGRDRAHSEVPAATARPALCASDLPSHLAVDDGRNGLVALRELVKRWACFPQQRLMMIDQAPRRYRWHDRLTSRRTTLCASRRWSMRLVTVTVSRFPAGSTSIAAVRPIGLATSLDPATE